jgi:hypothetical protein
MTTIYQQKEAPAKQIPVTESKWSTRFIWAAVAQGLVAAIVTLLIVEPQTYLGINSYFSPARVIAGGGGGTWMFTGYILYLVVGVLGVAVTSIFYFYIEGLQGKVYHGLTNLLAWGHYVFMNVGVAVAMLLMVYGGYMAGYAATAVSGGGLGYTNLQIHVTYLGPLENWIGFFALVAVLGVVLGGLGYVTRMRQKA